MALLRQLVSMREARMMRLTQPLPLLSSPFPRLSWSSFLPCKSRCAPPLQLLGIKLCDGGIFITGW